MELSNLIVNKKKLVLTVVIVLLGFGNLFFVIAYAFQAGEVQHLKQGVITQQTNAKVVSFLNLFIIKVLKTDKEVSFEDRLQLENAIRSINDPVLLEKWEKFTGGTNVDQIQAAVKELLEALVKKIVT